MTYCQIMRRRGAKSDLMALRKNAEKTFDYTSLIIIETHAGWVQKMYNVKGNNCQELKLSNLRV